LVAAGLRGGAIQADNPAGDFFVIFLPSRRNR
jgi:hypothetical protein